ncbi:tRNA(His) guanylyltransferase Thg1 family protein [bacterium]|jgi:tRNA(His) 5'-end guanylyltransferase|nr:tRNA(His) guanylyltransferase Thg1 family protein [bacterium]
MKKNKDSLGDRMKKNYEDRSKTYLTRRVYNIIRIDGRSFKNYTRGLERPFDMGLIDDMDNTAVYLCEKIQGVKCAFVQSDEISILVTDFDELNTSMWFDGSVQKIVSVSASMATSKFNHLRILRNIDKNNDLINDFCITDIYNIISHMSVAEFDSRVFTLPTKSEVANYFLWRQQDTTRNSISSVAQSLYSHKELEFKNTDQMQEMIFQKGINWNDYDNKLKRGRMIVKKQLENGRNEWVSEGSPIFSQDWIYINNLIPENK